MRVAAVQATPEILDAEATVEKACRLIGEAAAQGADLAVLPEVFVSIYPSNAWAADAGSFSGWDELWQRMWASSVEVPGPLTERLAAACGEYEIHCAIGVNERESTRSGSLYNTLLVIGPEGVLHKHRKLMPTMQERLFHGVGAGDDLGAVETPAGRVGGLICWENRMPLARYARPRRRGHRRPRVGRDRRRPPVRRGGNPALRLRPAPARTCSAASPPRFRPARRSRSAKPRRTASGTGRDGRSQPPARALLSAAAVSGPTIPSGVRPFACWKAMTAASVASPKAPSGVPGS